ncbi:hypothetical protein GLAREA_03258 [Glarea lozoyensis ATCC 20868]|uniref:Uncharacterized protein n=1 Tax=Glarea lozoyensis (strain ATCC 20868 / MF5171) TaxID=1116229 RepID=S3DLB6_GLAL2|nr:uncharacterized protein GLAREA_03258 [Glarea lozoyensis ATCC 20868]EPE27343.1 hypothetical protein GLAREA_03258 [Glarea lozoyensis ATCC 20868]
MSALNFENDCIYVWTSISRVTRDVRGERTSYVVTVGWRVLSPTNNQPTNPRPNLITSPMAPSSTTPPRVDSLGIIRRMPIPPLVPQTSAIAQGIARMRAEEAAEQARGNGREEVDRTSTLSSCSPGF